MRYCCVVFNTMPVGGHGAAMVLLSSSCLELLYTWKSVIVRMLATGPWSRDDEATLVLQGVPFRYHIRKVSPPNENIFYSAGTRWSMVAKEKR